MSNYCKKLADKFNFAVGTVNKLIPNLCDKKNYVLHYRYLQLYLELGLNVTKVDRVLKLKQSDLIKSFIDFNTMKRINAANDFEKDFFELMINSVYGKTMENLRKRINVRTVKNVKTFLKYVSRPTYKGHKFLIRTLNKPI